MSTETDAALRAAAEAATPGPWEQVHHRHYGPQASVSTPLGETLLGQRRDEGNYRGSEDATFIAAANPAAILDLLDRVEAAEAKVARVEALADDLPARTEGPLRVGTDLWPECDRDAYSLAIEEAQTAIRAALGDPQ